MVFVIDASPRARVLATGPDAAAFLHRLSTQHVKDLKPGDAVLSTFTTDKGRLVDVVHHVVVDADTVLLVGQATSSETLAAWLDRYCFTEQVSFSSLEHGCVLTDGATADGVVAGASALPPFGARTADGVMAIRTFDRANADGAVPAFLLVALTAEATLPTPRTGDAEADVVAAMAAGVPGPEVGDAHTPLDLELHDAIHWAKGCYIGQEVIARLDTYGKQRRRLVSVVGADVAVGDDVIVDGASVGKVTSALPTTTTSAAMPAALAMVKLAADALPVAATLRRGETERPATLQVRQTAQQPHD